MWNEGCETQKGFKQWAQPKCCIINRVCWLSPPFETGLLSGRDRRHQTDCWKIYMTSATNNSHTRPDPASKKSKIRTSLNLRYHKMITILINILFPQIYARKMMRMPKMSMSHLLKLIFCSLFHLLVDCSSICMLRRKCLQKHAWSNREQRRETYIDPRQVRGSHIKKWNQTSANTANNRN